MTALFLLECWNPYKKKYEKFGTFNNLERAEIMFNKSYFRKRTRRLILIETKLLYKEKGIY